MQDRVRSGGFKIEKVPGDQNVADLLTKHVDRAALCRHLAALGLVKEEGRASMAPRIDA